MKYVDEKGLEYFYEKIKDKLNEVDKLSEEIVDKVSQEQMESYINETFLGGEW